MSSTFDALDYALEWIDNKIDEDDDQAHDVIRIMRLIVRELHNYHHRHAPGLNAAAGRYPDLLLTALKYTDANERKMWLKIKAE